VALAGISSISASFTIKSIILLRRLRGRKKVIPMNPGAWKFVDVKDCPMPEAAATAFAAVTKDLEGASYQPMFYAGEQVVSGMNYCIICKQTLVTQNPVEHLVAMIIYVPAGGAGCTMTIKEII